MYSFFKTCTPPGKKVPFFAENITRAHLSCFSFSSSAILALRDPVMGPSLPPETDRLVVSHDPAKVLGKEELLPVHKERGVVGLERGEHAGDVGNLDVAQTKLELQAQKMPADQQGILLEEVAPSRLFGPQEETVGDGGVALVLLVVVQRRHVLLADKVDDEGSGKGEEGDERSGGDDETHVRGRLQVICSHHKIEYIEYIDFYT